MKKTLVVFFLFLFIFFFLNTKTMAAEMSVTCPESSGCSISGTDPLFSTSVDDFWYPGRILKKTFNMKNSGTEIREMALRALGTTQEDILKNVMNLSLTSSGGTVIWSGGLADFYNQSNINLGIFDPNASLDYNMTISMNSSANDEYQGKESVFDLTLGFWGDPIPTPTPTTTSGEILGTGVSAPPCTNDKPGLPTNFTAVNSGIGAVTLSWVAPAAPYTYFLVAYSDTSAWPPKWGNPDVGNVITYTVSGLGSGTYYFWIRAGNGCMPGDYVGPFSPGVTAGIAGAPAVAPGFAPGVLGAETPGELGGSEATATATQAGQTGEVAGIETQPFSWWWLIFPGIGLILFFFYLWKR